MEPWVTIKDWPLKFAEKFHSLDSVISNDGIIDAKITSCISKASAAFVWLIPRLWSTYEVSLATKISVFRSIIMLTLLHSCETWMPCHRNVQNLAST